MVGKLPRRLGVDEQRQMVIAEREAVRFEIVEGVAQFLNLRGGGIARGDELVLLTRQHRLGVGLDEKSEGLRQDELERQGEQAVQQPGLGGGRIFLDPEHAGEARIAAAPDFEGLAPEDDAVGIQRWPDRALRQGRWQPFAGDEHMQELHRFGKEDAMALDQSQGTCAIALKRRHDVARGVGEPLQGVSVDFRGERRRRGQAA